MADNIPIDLCKTSDSIGNFIMTMKSYFDDGVDEAIAYGHKLYVEKVVNGEKVDPNIRFFLSGYKKLIKQEKRKRDIVDKARDFLEDNAKPQEITEDWMDFFFEKAKLVSSNEMQLIWAQLLAEEANNPGSISFSLLHSLSIMTFEQAQFFCNISRFALREYKKDSVNLLVFYSSNYKAYNNSKIDDKKLKELERLGLIICDFNNEFIFHNKKIFSIGNRLLTIYGDPNNENKIKAGNAEFTVDGQLLYKIIDQSFKGYNDSIIDFIIKKFKRRGCRVLVDNSDV